MISSHVDSISRGPSEPMNLLDRLVASLGSLLLKVFPADRLHMHVERPEAIHWGDLIGFYAFEDQRALRCFSVLCIR